MNEVTNRGSEEGNQKQMEETLVGKKDMEVRDEEKDKNGAPEEKKLGEVVDVDSGMEKGSKHGEEKGSKHGEEGDKHWEEEDKHGEEGAGVLERSA